LEITAMKIKAMEMTAVFSACEKYRYALTRVWEPAKPMIAFCMLNPSTADDKINDPTVRRCIGFAQQWGYGGLIVVNAYALRSPKPADLKKTGNPVQSSADLPRTNDAWILYAAFKRDIVFAWGQHAKYLNRDAAIARLFGDVEMKCLGQNADGSPKHPLFLKGATERVTWLLPFPRVYDQGSTADNLIARTTPDIKFTVNAGSGQIRDGIFACCECSGCVQPAIKLVNGYKLCYGCANAGKNHG
jgi:hypothetical protein